MQAVNAQQATHTSQIGFSDKAGAEELAKPIILDPAIARFATLRILRRGLLVPQRARTTGKASKGPAASETDNAMNPGVALGKPVRVKMPLPI